MQEPTLTLLSAPRIPGKIKGAAWGGMVIPIYRWREANEALRKKLDEPKGRVFLNLQEEYNWMEESIREVVKQVGERKSRPTTNDKISEETKNLIIKRTEIRSKPTLDWYDQIKLCELRKLIKKGVRRDIRVYEQELMNGIWEESGSSKKIRKALMQGQNLYPAIKSRNTNEKIFVKKEIAKAAIDFSGTCTRMKEGRKGKPTNTSGQKS